MAHDFGFAAADPFAGRPDAAPARMLVRRTARVRVLSDLAVGRCVGDLGRLPEPGESFHCLTRRGWYAWQLVPAVLNLAGGAVIDHLAVATLSFAGAFMGELLELLDAGRIGSVRLLASVYFKAHNEELFGELAEALAERGQTAAADLNHAKVMALALSDGRRFVVEGSANLRTCSSREQLILTSDPDLYAHHAAWIEQAVQAAA